MIFFHNKRNYLSTYAYWESVFAPCDCQTSLSSKKHTFLSKCNVVSVICDDDMTFFLPKIKLRLCLLSSLKHGKNEWTNMKNSRSLIGRFSDLSLMSCYFVPKMRYRGATVSTSHLKKNIHIFLILVFICSKTAHKHYLNVFWPVIS